MDEGRKHKSKGGTEGGAAPARMPMALLLIPCRFQGCLALGPGGILPRGVGQGGRTQNGRNPARQGQQIGFSQAGTAGRGRQSITASYGTGNTERELRQAGARSRRSRPSLVRVGGSAAHHSTARHSAAQRSAVEPSYHQFRPWLADAMAPMTMGPQWIGCASGLVAHAGGANKSVCHPR